MDRFNLEDRELESCLDPPSFLGMVLGSMCSTSTSGSTGSGSRPVLVPDDPATGPALDSWGKIVGLELDLATRGFRARTTPFQGMMRG